MTTQIASCFKGVVQREFIRMGMSINPEAIGVMSFFKLSV
jgi:hypothetical protein